ncbi:MAG: hypothetical protein JW783_02435 [Bacteroidales bacterium]|nr:hypothetical protein [Bacteroidales bacterium]MBN2749817.1 hypothetical protein [Bacteroidales bacterium]
MNKSLYQFITAVYGTVVGLFLQALAYGSFYRVMNKRMVNIKNENLTISRQTTEYIKKGEVSFLSSDDSLNTITQMPLNLA